MTCLNFLYEVQDASLYQFTVTKLNHTRLHRMTAITLSPVDCLSVGYFFTWVCRTTTDVSRFEAIDLNDHCVRFLMKGLTKGIAELEGSKTQELPGSLCVTLFMSNIHADGIHSIAQFLQSSNIVKKICLDPILSSHECNIGELGMRYISEALIRNTSLTELKMMGCNIEVTEENGPVVQKMLENNQTLQTLKLEFNRAISDTGAHYIGRGLMHNTTLKCLSLPYCGITSEGVRSLAEILMVNRSLEELHLDGNKIADEGVSYLAKGLTNTTLKCLSLQCCGITSEGARSLAEMLAVNRSLERLHLSGNKILDEGVSYLSKGLMNTTTLEQLTLRDCDITVKGLEELANALTVNRSLENLNYGDPPEDKLPALCESLKASGVLQDLLRIAIEKTVMVFGEEDTYTALIDILYEWKARNILSTCSSEEETVEVDIPYYYCP